MENIRRFVRLARSSGKGITRRFTVSQLFLLGMVVCNLFIPQMIQTIADEGIARQDLDVVVNTALWMVLLAFVSALLQILNAGYAVGFSVRVAHGLRTRFLEGLLPRSVHEPVQGGIATGRRSGGGMISTTLTCTSPGNKITMTKRNIIISTRSTKREK